MAKKNEDFPAGYQISFHRSLTQPMYWMGVPRNLFLLEVLIGIIGAVIVKTFWIPVIVICCHFLFRFLGQQDPEFHTVFWRSKDYKERYYH